MNTVNPSTAEIGKRGEVLIAREPLRLEAPALTCRCGLLDDRVTADDPAHGRIARQTVSVVHVFISGKTTEH